MRPSKKSQIVQQALDIFYQHGFQATGIDLVVSKTGISKTTIYNHFSSKEALISAVLDKRDQDFRTWLADRVEQLSITAQDKIYCVFDALDEWFESNDFRGCMFVRSSLEFPAPEGPIFKQSQLHKKRLQQYFCQLASSAGLPDPENVAKQILILKEGAIIAANLKLVEMPGRQAKLMLQTLLKG